METNYKNITEERYEDLYGIAPILYISTIDGQRVQKGFAVCEALDHNPKGAVLAVCFKKDGQFYQAAANISNDTGFITDYLGNAGTRGNTAETVFHKAWKQQQQEQEAQQQQTQQAQE